MIHQYPETVTFAVFSDEVPKPTVVIKRNGLLKQRNPSLNTRDVTVLLQGDDKTIDITAKQYRAMVQLVRIALRHNPCAKIVFNGAASPWGLDCLPRYDERWMTVPDAMRMRPTKIQKVLVRKKALHPVIKERRAEARQGLQ
ncbi:hypothetical protein IVB22_10785 [Bradyrhizobium sp. 190]|uniref:hypothetical protein n=1 Tax=Bradyrhizobium sp. 190 TaxID=2782658 RepID=UPI001FF7B29A|nr:hypothetical protein [Bradyrhizobium sp. 190]MCK1513050.1 hypothetical protein [Bradyrhizobium sp. 190]